MHSAAISFFNNLSQYRIMKGSYKPPLFFSAGLMILGVIAVLSNPLNPLYIVLGMFFIGIAMINLALAIPVEERKRALIIKPVKQPKIRTKQRRKAKKRRK